VHPSMVGKSASSSSAPFARVRHLRTAATATDGEREQTLPGDKSSPTEPFFTALQRARRVLLETPGASADEAAGGLDAFRRLSVAIALALAACVMMGLAVGSCGGNANSPTAPSPTPTPSDPLQLHTDPLRHRLRPRLPLRPRHPPQRDADSHAGRPHDRHQRNAGRQLVRAQPLRTCRSGSRSAGTTPTASRTTATQNGRRLRHRPDSGRANEARRHDHTAGTLSYHCSVHPSMTGTLT
jgi:hypothetical protein